MDLMKITTNIVHNFRINFILHHYIPNTIKGNSIGYVMTFSSRPYITVPTADLATLKNKSGQVTEQCNLITEL
jgi:hypothetical protein